MDYWDKVISKYCGVCTIEVSFFCGYIRGMKKLLYAITPVFLSTFLSFCFLMGPVVRAETQSYLVTVGIDTPYPSLLNGSVYFTKFIQLRYSTGRVMLSSTPDGTGAITPGDVLQVTDHFSTHNLIYKGYEPGCTVFHDTIPAQDISSLVYATTYAGTPDAGLNNILVRLSHWCLRPKHIGPLYIVVIREDPPTPTPSPTLMPSPTPTPSGPEPFLDLPWDYESAGLSFTEAAMAISSFFDHEYPLLGGGTSEPQTSQASIVTYKGPQRTTDLYSSHDGYDYARVAKALYGTHVRAAAAGTARYVQACKNCGNMVVIDHGNGYQTRYMHLQKDGLVSTDSAKLMPVDAGDVIGQVGSSGNSSGPHIHFGVYQDKDGDGVFDIPDGATDPYGWDSKDPDPWEHYSFEYFKKQKTGNKSYYLWKKPLAKAVMKMGTTGVVLQTERLKVTVPSGVVPDNSELKILPAPAIIDSNGFRSVGSTFIIEMRNPLDEFIRSFLHPLLIEIDFQQFDLTGIKPETLAIYSSEDGEVWNKEETEVDFTSKKAIVHTSHLTQFALMGERADTEPPVTTAVVDGLKGSGEYYRSAVDVSLFSHDNTGGVGVEKTLFSLDGEAWEEYTEPLRFATDGTHVVVYYSWDADGNIEEAHRVEFTIDTVLPEVSIRYDVDKEDIVVAGTDDSNTAQTVQTEVKHNKQIVSVSDPAGNNIVVDSRERTRGKNSNITIYSLRYNSGPVIDINDTRYSVSLQRARDGSITTFRQVFIEKGLERAVFEYDRKRGVTKITFREKGAPKVELMREGLISLHIRISNGTINYVY